MAKQPVLTDIVNVANSASTHNANNDAIEVAFDNTLSRDGSSPNQMEADIDLNGNDLLNVKNIGATGTITVDGAPIAPASPPASVSYKTRVNAVDAIANGLSLVDGSILSADGHLYKASSTATNISDMPGWVPVYPYTLEHFGALGDGITDDTTAWDEAVVFGDILLLDKTYIVEQVKVVSNRTIQSVGGGTLKAKDGSVANPKIINANAVDGWKFIGVTFDGNSANITSFDNVVQSFNCNDAAFINCSWKNTLGIASLVSSGSSVRHDRCTFKNCGIENRTTLDPADRRQAIAYTGSTQGSVTDCDFENVGLDCISVATNSDDFIVSGNRINSCDAAGIYVSTSKKATITDNNIKTGSGGGNGIDTNFCESLTLANNVCVGNGAGGILIADGSYITVSGNICRNNWQGGVSVHRGGITLSTTTAASVNEVTLSDNVCHDTQGVGNVTQRYGIGVVVSGTGSFGRVRIHKNNSLTGYDGSGNENPGGAFQTTDLLMSGYPQSFNLNDLDQVKLYDATGVYEEFGIIQLNANSYGRFLARDANSPIELQDDASAYVTTDTGTTQAVYHTGGEVFLRNRTGLTRSYRVTWI